MQLACATFEHAHRKIPHPSFLSSKELCGQELSQYWTGNTPGMHWPSLSSLRSFPISHTIDTAFCTPYASSPRSPMMLNSKTQSWIKAQSDVKLTWEMLEWKNITFNEKINLFLKKKIEGNPRCAHARINLRAQLSACARRHDIAHAWQIPET